MPWHSKLPGASIFAHQIDFRPLWRAVRDHPEKFILAAGVLLRLLVYAQGRSYWMDEGTLEANVAGKPPLDFSASLSGDQLAPIGFLIAERAIVSILGASRYVTRLLPLAAGILALFGFAKLAGGILPRRAALVALALFAFSDDLIYYASEFKPYSVDLAIGVAITLLTFDATARPVTARRTFLVALVAFLAPWCSFSSAFVVAACGMSLLLTARSLRRALAWIAIGAVWLASFVIAHRASQALLSPYTTMYIFWWFAFLPLWPFPPDPASLARAGGILLEIFVNPLNLVPPIPRWMGIVLPLLLLLAGALRLFRRSWPAFLMLVLPFALAVVASAMKRYPLHGRLMLELVPALFLLIALGTESVFELDRGRRKLFYKIVLVLLLAYPVFSAIYEASATRPRYFNSHGDLHNNLFLIEEVNRPPRPVKS
jgi:hypothetical protein